MRHEDMQRNLAEDTLTTMITMDLVQSIRIAGVLALLYVA